MHFRVQDGTLTIELTFWEKVWSIHGSLRIPLDHVRVVTQELPPTSWKQMRAPGTFLPGVIKAGTYFTPRGKEFWYVTRWHKKYCTIELGEGRYARLVLGLEQGVELPILISSKGR